MQQADYTSTILAFLHQIGIITVFKDLTEDTFLPGLEIYQGKLYIDMEKLKYVGDLVHEAGHLAVTLASKRETVSANDLTDSGEEIATLLWSYAAAKAMDLPLEVVFHSQGYKGSSDWLIETFESRNYMGLPLLEWMGLTAGEHKAKELGIAPFPNMIKWLRD